jgi:hypothetical protein
MNSFFEYFGKCGFNPLAIRPGYGLAEFTLCATAQEAGRPLFILYVDQAVLSKKKEVLLVPKGAPGAVCYVGVGQVRQTYAPSQSRATPTWLHKSAAQGS